MTIEPTDLTYTILYLFELDIRDAEAGKPVSAEHLRFGINKARGVRGGGCGRFTPLVLAHMVERAERLHEARTSAGLEAA